MTQYNVEDLGTINPKHASRIKIWQNVTERGDSYFHILHKKSYFHKPTMENVPKEYRVRKTFKGAEDAALYLLINYIKYF